MIEAFISSQAGRIIISVLWGLALSVLFQRSCDGNNCVVVTYKGPDPGATEKQTWNFGDKKQCFKFKPYVTECK